MASPSVVIWVERCGSRLVPRGGGAGSSPGGLGSGNASRKHNHIISLVGPIMWLCFLEAIPNPGWAPPSKFGGDRRCHILNPSKLERRSYGWCHRDSPLTPRGKPSPPIAPVLEDRTPVALGPNSQLYVSYLPRDPGRN